MEIEVDVNENDISKGVRSGFNKCPIALAVKRHVYSVSVGIAYLGFRRYEGAQWQSVPMSKEAKRFIEMFDSGRPVSPFTFKLNLI